MLYMRFFTKVLFLSFAFLTTWNQAYMKNTWSRFVTSEELSVAAASPPVASQHTEPILGKCNLVFYSLW